MKRGQTCSDEAKLKMSIAAKLKHQDPDYKAKYLATQALRRGCKMSDETKAKMKASQLKRYEKVYDFTPDQILNPLKLVNISIKENRIMNQYTKDLIKDIKKKYNISASTHVNRLMEIHFDRKSNNKEYLIVILKRYDIENPIFIHNKFFEDINFKNLFLSISMKIKPKAWTLTDKDPENV